MGVVGTAAMENSLTTQTYPERPVLKFNLIAEKAINLSGLVMQALSSHCPCEKQEGKAARSRDGCGPWIMRAAVPCLHTPAGGLQELPLLGAGGEQPHAAGRCFVTPHHGH